MLHYYLQKGIKPQAILSQGFATQLFYKASMELAEEKGGDIAALLPLLFGSK